MLPPEEGEEGEEEGLLPPLSPPPPPPPSRKSLLTPFNMRAHALGVHFLLRRFSTHPPSSSSSIPSRRTSSLFSNTPILQSFTTSSLSHPPTFPNRLSTAAQFSASKWVGANASMRERRVGRGVVGSPTTR